jgi:hypothetical protein
MRREIVVSFLVLGFMVGGLPVRVAAGQSSKRSSPR